ncbi:MAG: hypothetical protein C0392_07345 [Syntrophus sp. (in: bacteria)]|nr:hypothetical protein [Syntrophus sp. (in: bacteria)]
MEQKRKKKRGRPYNDIHRRHYEESHSFYNLMKAFTISYNSIQPMPKWILDILYRGFREYETNKGQKSLDEIFGISHAKGKRNEYNERERESRNYFLMSNVYQAKHYYRVTVREAVTIVIAFLDSTRKYHEWHIPSTDTIAKMYSYEKVSKTFRPAFGGDYHFHEDGTPFPEEFREYIPDEIRIKRGIEKESPYPKSKYSVHMKKTWAQHKKDLDAEK